MRGLIAVVFVLLVVGLVLVINKPPRQGAEPVLSEKRAPVAPAPKEPMPQQPASPQAGQVQTAQKEARGGPTASQRPPSAVEAQADAEAKAYVFQILADRLPALSAAWLKVQQSQLTLAAAAARCATLEGQPDVWSLPIAREKNAVAYWGRLARYRVSLPTRPWVAVETDFASLDRMQSHQNRLSALERDRDAYIADLQHARQALAAAQKAAGAAAAEYNRLYQLFVSKAQPLWLPKYEERKAALEATREQALHRADAQKPAPEEQ